MMNESALTVSELNLMVTEAIRRDPRTRDVSVRGEISGFKRHLATGHWYFSLKDAGAAVSCVMFRTAASRAEICPKDGDQVIARGYVDIYAPQGKYQLYVTGLRSAGTGDLYLQLEEMKRRLAAEGLFDPGRKRELPLMPRKVAVVTSRSGAALHDILNVSRMRCPFIPIVLIPVTVQGAGAGREIAEGIRKADGETDADVIIVARGGGTAEDLWCFNDEAVARAVAACRKPVVSGVGHEIDTTLCDLAADVRASTPSNAAEITFPDVRELRGRIGLLRSGLGRAQTNGLRKAELELKEAQRRLSALSPDRRIHLLRSRQEMARLRLLAVARSTLDRKAGELRDAGNALESAASGRIRQAELASAKLRERLSAVNPMAVLRRGYAIVYDADSRVVSRAAEAEKQDEMALQFADGRVAVTRKGTV